jgi:hypothetical protein
MRRDERTGRALRNDLFLGRLEERIGRVIGGLKPLARTKSDVPGTAIFLQCGGLDLHPALRPETVGFVVPPRQA